MHLLPRRIRNTVLGIIGIGVLFLSFLYSDFNMVGFSEFAFLSGAIETDTLNITTTGGHTTNFTVVVYNKEDISKTYKLGFVDAGITNDSFAQRTCLSPNENQSVGKYILGNSPSFTLAAGTSGTENLSVTFPNSHSGTYHGCITLSPITTDGSTGINTLPTRGIFLDAQVTPLTNGFYIIVRPAFRPNSNNTGYSISDANFWLFTYENSAWTGLYNSVKNPGDAKIDIDRFGNGVVSFIPPASGTLYLIAFKGSGTLSLGFTGIWNNTITGFNFFTGDLADSLDTEFMFKYFNGGMTGNYLKVGDLITDTIGTYDFIKDQDFTIMTNSLSLGTNMWHPYRYDLDTNSVINALEQTMLLDSYNRIGFITSQSYISINDFITF